MKISKYFSKEELECKCGCGRSNTNSQLLNYLDRIRILYGKPIIITSGCRCSTHNKAVGGTQFSDHLILDFQQCVAVDITCNSSKDRWDLIKYAMIVGIDRIGIHKDFLHLGLSERNTKDTIWIYK